jgi:ATP-dependent protease HslVU (ClpYQ) peptidase subunit
MTTIAIRDRFLACDSRLTRGHHVQSDNTTKAYPLPNGGGVLAYCGLAIDLSRFLDAFKQKSLSHFRMEEGTDIILARPNGTVRIWQCVSGGFCGHFDTRVPPHGLVWGSGGAYAMGAMLAGANVRKAVEIAAIGDVNTGGEIHVYDIKTGERI